MKLINKENNVSLAFSLPPELPQTFLKLASVLAPATRAPMSRAKIFFVFQSFRERLLQRFSEPVLPNGRCFTWRPAHWSEPGLFLLSYGKESWQCCESPSRPLPGPASGCGLFPPVPPIFIKSIIGCFRVVADYPLISPTVKAPGRKRSLVIPKFIKKSSFMLGLGFQKRQETDALQKRTRLP